MSKIALIEPSVGHFHAGMRHILSDLNTAPGNDINHILSVLTFGTIRPTTYFPLHLANLAAPLLEKGEDVRIFDENIEEKNLVKKIIRYSPDIIAFSCKTSPALIRVDRMSKELKKVLGVPIIFGGHHPTIAPRQTLETTVADYVVIGEGDEVFPKIVDSIKSRTKPPRKGVGYKKNGKAIVTRPVIVRDLNSIAMPDTSIFKMNKYHIFPVQSSRGCIRQCSFCYYSAFSCPWRMKSTDRVIREIEYLVSECQIGRKMIFFADENFAVNLKHTENLCLAMREFDTNWFAMIDKCLDGKLLALMEKAGARILYIGVDYKTKVISGPAKKRTIPELINFSKRTKECGINLSTSYILMRIDQTRRDLEIIYKLIVKMKPYFLDMNIYRPYPNTADYFEALKRGFQPPRTFYEWGKLMNDILNLRNLNRINFTDGLTEHDIMHFLLKTAIYNAKNLLGVIRYVHL